MNGTKEACMLWFGTDKARFKVQRGIAIVVLLIAVFFLAAQVEAWFSGSADFGAVLKGVFLTGFAGGMFYLAGRW
jgi:hypothetical protein